MDAIQVRDYTEKLLYTVQLNERIHLPSEISLWDRASYRWIPFSNIMNTYCQDERRHKDCPELIQHNQVVRDKIQFEKDLQEQYERNGSMHQEANAAENAANSLQENFETALVRFERPYSFYLLYFFLILYCWGLYLMRQDRRRQSSWRARITSVHICSRV